MPEKILIVDDTPANMSVLLDVLEPHGYVVAAAPNGLVALNVVSRLQPDLILLDIMMPELDGLATCRRLKANPATAEIPVLFLSARDDSASVLDGFRAGAADYIVKPFQPEEVLARVQLHLRLSALTRDLRGKNSQLKQTNEDLEREIARRKQTEEALSTADARLAQIADSESLKWGLNQFVGASPGPYRHSLFNPSATGLRIGQRPHHRRIGHRQGTRRPGHPLRLLPRPRPVPPH